MREGGRGGRGGGTKWLVALSLWQDKTRPRAIYYYALCCRPLVCLCAARSVIMRQEEK